MTVQTLKLGGKRFVVLPEKDYRELKARPPRKAKPRRLTAQDKGDIAEAKRREHEPSIPLEAVRQRPGL